LALSHTIAQAMLRGMLTNSLPFFRTPKKAVHGGLVRALHDAREETLFLFGLTLSAGIIEWQQGSELPDARIWSMVLLIQAIPYAASLLVSIVSAFPGLPANIVGPMDSMSNSTLQDDSQLVHGVTDPKINKIPSQI
ncbi:MAG: hypothetical protein KZQ92_01780, partial [Candidatus Thiodiazotropha sp. (ex Lucinoma borealis)]|nr:hypothetical protein [Candidatus Thiodiazotropha sp. (ex Lucinoma borealis)]